MVPLLIWDVESDFGNAIDRHCGSRCELSLPLHLSNWIQTTIKEHCLAVAWRICAHMICGQWEAFGKHVWSSECAFYIHFMSDMRPKIVPEPYTRIRCVLHALLQQNTNLVDIFRVEEAGRTTCALCLRYCHQQCQQFKIVIVSSVFRFAVCEPFFDRCYGVYPMENGHQRSMIPIRIHARPSATDTQLWSDKVTTKWKSIN